MTASEIHACTYEITGIKFYVFMSQVRHAIISLLINHRINDTKQAQVYIISDVISDDASKLANKVLVYDVHAWIYNIAIGTIDSRYL